jgi:hypothetical protein
MTETAGSRFDWLDVLLRTATVGVVAFLMLQVKELFDAGRLDTPGTLVDALLVAGGMLVLNLAQELLKRPASR